MGGAAPGGDTLLGQLGSYVTVTTLTTLLGPTVTYFLTEASPEFHDFMLKHLENSFKLIGVEAEDQIKVRSSDVKMITNDELYRRTMNTLALRHELTWIDPIDLLSVELGKYMGKFSKFFDYAESTYYAGLPTTTVRTRDVPLGVVVPIITAEYRYTPNVLAAEIRTPEKEEWCGYKLWQLYGYRPWEQKMEYDGYTYVLDYTDYNYGTNMYDCGFYVPATVTTNVTTEVTVTITPYDATYDNKNVRAVVTTETIHSIEGTSTVVEDDSPGADTLIPIGSEVNSYTVDTVYGSPVAIKYLPVVINVLAYNLVHHMVVKFDNASNNEVCYWLYEVGSGNSTLDNASMFVSYLQLMPIVELRNNSTMVSGNQLEQAKEILNLVGVSAEEVINGLGNNPGIGNVRNAYVYFGVDMGESNPIIAKMMFQMFDALFYDPSLGGTSGYTATFTEGNFNAALGWRHQYRNVITGSIGAVGTYTNHKSGNNIVLRKQETAAQYVQYTLEDVTVSNIISVGGMWDVVINAPSTGQVVVPLSKELVYDLTTLEQMELYALSLRLVTYSADITHLEFYETEDFAKFLQVVAVIVTIVVTIFTFYTGYAAGNSVYAGITAVAKAALYGVAISMAFNALIDAVDNPYLKAALGIIATIVASVYGGVSAGASMLSMTAEKLSEEVTNYVDNKFKELEKSIQVFQDQFDVLNDILSGRMDAMSLMVSTEDVAKLTSYEVAPAYLTGPALEYYKARDMQYDWDMLKGATMYKTAYDFDKYLTVGVINTVPAP